VTSPILWFTGRPGSGKSTIANAVLAGLRTRRVPVELLDQRQLAETLGSTADPAAAEARLLWLLEVLNRHGIVTLVISEPADGPAAERARGVLRDFIEVYVDTPLEICVDRIGIRAAEEPFANPVNPDLRVVTHDREVQASAAQVLSLLDTIDLTRDTGAGDHRPWASAGA
jgi:adenylylsulfate kinase